MQVAAFLQDDQLHDLAKLLAPPLKEWLQRWAAYGGPGPAEQPPLVEAGRSAECSHAERDGETRGADNDEAPRQRRRVAKAAAEASPAERALDVLQALPPSAAASALAAVDCGLWTMLAALPRALHGAALQALCTAVPAGKLRLCLDFATHRDRFVPRSGAGALAPGLRSLGGLASLKAFDTTPTDLCEILRACSGLQALSSVAVRFTQGARLWPGFEREFAPLTCLRALDLQLYADSKESPPGNRHAALPLMLCGMLPRLQRLRCLGDVLVEGAPTPCARPACAPAALTWLDVGVMHLTDGAHLSTCSEQLGALACLRRLCLSACNLTGAGVAALAAALPPTPELTYLHFCSKQLQTDGLAALALIIGRAAALRSLDFTGTPLNNVGGSPLAAALAAATSLTGLRFEACKMGDAGTRALAAKVLPTLTKLRVLDLQHNNVPEDAGLALVAALKPLTALRRVALWGGGNVVPAVFYALKQNSKRLARGLYDPELAWDGDYREPLSDERWKSDEEERGPAEHDCDDDGAASEDADNYDDDDDVCEAPWA